MIGELGKSHSMLPEISGGNRREFRDLGSDLLAQRLHSGALLLRGAQETGAFLLVQIDEHRIGIGILHLDGVGGEIRLALLGGDIRHDLDAALLEFGEDRVAATLAEIVVYQTTATVFALTSFWR